MSPRFSTVAPGGGGDISYFGDPPYPSVGWLRAGNDAGEIFAFRNHANTADYYGWGLGGSAASAHDTLIFGGWLGLTQSGDGNHIITTDATPFASHATFGGANSAGEGDFEEMTAGTLYATGTTPGLSGNLVHTSLTTVADGTANPLTNYGLLTTEQGRVVLRAGNVNAQAELLYSGGIAYFQPSPVDGSSTTGYLGAASVRWVAAFLGPGTTTIAPLNLGSGVAPTAPADGDLWITTSGLYARINGVTVGPMSAGGGAGTLAAEEAGSPVSGSPFSTFNFNTGATLSDAGGGVLQIDITAAGVTGSGTTNQLAVWTGSTALGDSAIMFNGSNSWTVNTGWSPDSNATRNLGLSSAVWKQLFVRQINSDNASFGTGLIVNGPDQGGIPAVDFQSNDQNLWHIASHNDGGALYPDSDNAEDLGTASLRIRDIYVHGQLKQTGTDKAGAGTLAVNNAPTSGTPVWVPITFNGTAYAVPAVAV